MAALWAGSSGAGQLEVCFVEFLCKDEVHKGLMIPNFQLLPLLRSNHDRGGRPQDVFAHALCRLIYYVYLICLKIFYGEIALCALALKVSFECQVNQLRFPLRLRLKEGPRMEDGAQVKPCQPRRWCWWQCRWCYNLGRRTAWSQENVLENSIESKWQEMPSEFKSIERINQSLLIFLFVSIT